MDSGYLSWEMRKLRQVTQELAQRQIAKRTHDTPTVSTTRADKHKSRHKEAISPQPTAERARPIRDEEDHISVSNRSHGSSELWTHADGSKLSSPHPQAQNHTKRQTSLAQYLTKQLASPWEARGSGARSSTPAVPRDQTRPRQTSSPHEPRTQGGRQAGKCNG